MAGPVFLFCSHGRSGSTLLQRVLSSGSDLFVWGENDGLAARLLAQVEQLEEWGREHREDFAREGLGVFLARLTPGRESLMAAARAYLSGLYEEATRAVGRTRWGFKEVRHGVREARFLGTLFPDARFLFLVRHPADVVASMAGSSWYITSGLAPGVLRGWAAKVDSMATWRDPRLLIVSYEDLVRDPRGQMARIAAHLGLSAEGFDLSLFERRVRGGFPPPQPLGPMEYVELHRPDVLRAAALVGYDVLSHPGLEPFHGRSWPALRLLGLLSVLSPRLWRRNCPRLWP